MFPNIIVQILGIVAAIIFMASAYSRKRIRAPWAKYAFSIAGMLVIIMCLGYMMLEQHWLTPHSHKGYELIRVELGQAGGMGLGLIIALILSGQLRGTKRLRSDAPQVGVNLPES